MGNGHDFIIKTAAESAVIGSTSVYATKQETTIYWEMKKNMILLIFFAGIGITVSAQQHFRCGDTLTDLRDVKKYPTVLIGSQCWTSKNMNIGIQVQNTSQSDNKVIEKTCYSNKKENCDTLGGLYTFKEAIQYASSGQKIQGVCPSGWHIPTKDEYEQLIITLGKDDAGQKMKVTKQNYPKWDGTNESGLSAIPAGLAYYDVFGRKGDWGVFWTATSVNPDYAWSVELDNYYKILSGYTNVKMTDTYLVINAFSVRCVKD
jgi:uncharacterized protein (TIGR02145 family)